MSDAVRGAVGTKLALTFMDQGEQAVKNIPDLVRAYLVRAYQVREESGFLDKAGKPPPNPDASATVGIPITSRYLMMSFLGWARLAGSEYLEAVKASTASISEAPGYARLCLVTSLVGLGEIDAAKLEYQRLLSIAPQYAVGIVNPMGGWTSHFCGAKKYLSEGRCWDARSRDAVDDGPCEIQTQAKVRSDAKA